jgi:hypothetical protein
MDKPSKNYNDQIIANKRIDTLFFTAMSIVVFLLLFIIPPCYVNFREIVRSMF